MNGLDWFFNGDYGSAAPNWPAMFLGLLLAFGASVTNAAEYQRGAMMRVAQLYISPDPTSAKLSDIERGREVVILETSREWLHVTANVITAFGMMAVFAIVRFRNILRDTLDTAYILSVLVIGMACRTQKFSSAVLGCGLLSMVLVFLWYTSFGSRHRYDIIVNLHWARSMKEIEDLRRILSRHSWKTHLANQRSHEGYEGTDLSYRLLLRDSNRVEDLLSELRQVTGVSRVTSMLAEDESEL